MAKTMTDIISDIRTYKVEITYQKLLILDDQRSEDEDTIFQIMNYDRNKNSILSQKKLNHFTRYHIYYDWDGEPIEQWEWNFKNTYFSTNVEKNIINGWLVSTVWIGLNSCCFTNNFPLIFETMIFKNDDKLPDNKFCNEYVERYSSYEQALEGHKKACEAVKYLEIIIEGIEDDKEEKTND